MSRDRKDRPELWPTHGRKSAAVFAVIWAGEGFLIMTFAKWVAHGSAVYYWPMIPWTVLGSILLLRPNLLRRVKEAGEQKMERDMSRLDKWTPPLP